VDIQVRGIAVKFKRRARLGLGRVEPLGDVEELVFKALDTKGERDARERNGGEGR
jgi:hypothetical protein